MGFNGADGFNSSPDAAPFVVTANNGFRAWYMKDWKTGVLSSLCFSHEWAVGINHARNHSVYGGTFTSADDGVEVELTPRHSNSCGFYAYYAEDYYQQGTYATYPRINGVMEGFGHCVVGEKGFRAQMGLIVAFARPFYIGEYWSNRTGIDFDEAQHLVGEALERRYPMTPIFDSVEQMLHRVPLIGRPNY